MISVFRKSLSSQIWLTLSAMALIIVGLLIYSSHQQTVLLEQLAQAVELVNSSSPNSPVEAKQLHALAAEHNIAVTRYVLIFGTLIMGMLITVGWLTVRSYRRNLATIAANTAEIARGNTQITNSFTLGTAETDLANHAITDLLDTLIALQKELASITQASRNGDLKRRASTQQFNGLWEEILQGVNAVLDEALVPIQTQAATLQRMAEGNLSTRITTTFVGDHAQISDAINKVAVITEDALAEFNQIIDAFMRGDFNQRANLDKYSGDWLRIMQGVNTILESVLQSANTANQQNWVNGGLSGLAEKMRGDLQVTDLSHNIIRFLAEYLDAHAGALYVFSKNTQRLVLAGSYAYPESHKHISFALGEGLIGQSAQTQQSLYIQDLPNDYWHIHSGLGESQPKVSLIIPIAYEGQLKGVIELASLTKLAPLSREFISKAAHSISVSLQTAETSEQTRLLLTKTMEQARTLQLQQEELQQSNEELEEQTQQLRANEEQLRKQQEELRQSNEELDERSQELIVQATQIREKNAELEESQASLSARASELEAANKYKSEFLANMSHELRTPLNSMLLLARTLADNREANLSPRQIEAAQVIHNSGNDLLNIINDILDLSKIEAGKVDLLVEPVSPAEIAERVQALYRHVAEEKALHFNLTIAPTLPATFNTDPHRLGQILRNLLSNAFKFTASGGVTLSFEGYDPKALPAASKLSEAGILIKVQDTGIGIPLEKQSAIWEAFQQADGSTCREYGGTGLGLTITRELVSLLGGEIYLDSTPNAGSSFNLYLPFIHATPSRHEHDAPLARSMNSPASTSNFRALKPTQNTTSITTVRAHDDRAEVNNQQKYILVVEDDPKFAAILGELCHKMDMPFITTVSGEESLEQISRNRPSAVILDLKLAGNFDGRYILSHLKTSVDTMHIPVHIISAEDRDMGTLVQGAVGFLTKPVSQEDLVQVSDVLSRYIKKSVKDVLVVEDNPELCLAIGHLLEAKDICIHSVGTAELARQELQTGQYDLVILDLGLPDMSGLELLEFLKSSSDIYLPPVIIYTGRDLDREEYEQLQKYSDSIIIKGACSEERLVADATIFLHRVAANMPESQRKMVYSLHDRNAMFNDKRVLLVDDDIRNIFALSSVLENQGLQITTARNGQEALDILADQSPTEKIDLVLMDIMMPVMDGLEAMRKIRNQPTLAKLPVIALTAKAMKEDKNACMQAGANDYLTKPVNVDRLIASLRIWLYR